jgi:molybdate transport system substrate-binding protein
MTNVHRILVLALLASTACPKRTESFRVAAASDLQNAFEELGAKFEADTGVKPAFDFGSSGLLAKQIEQGAPYALYAAANKEFVDTVVASGKCDKATAQVYSRGRIVVFTPNGVEPPKTLADVLDPRFKKIAIANPAHAPYGKAAQQALEKVDAWSQIQDRLVLGENIQAAMMYAHNKNVDVAIVALSLAINYKADGTYYEVPPDLYAPLDQALVVCGGGNDAQNAKRFVALVASAQGREIMKRYGFELPAR